MSDTEVPVESWFANDESVEAELRRTFRPASLPSGLFGYDDLVEFARGGQATVYRARQRSTGRTVAIKVFFDRPGHAAPEQRRFLREVELVSALRHPSIVTLFDGGVTDDGRPFLVMEFVRGVTLDRAPQVVEWRSAVGDPERLRQLLELFAAIVDAVAHAHLHGVIHRDLKPSNVLVDESGRPRVLDFGLARAVAGSALGESTLSLDGSFAGTLAYASPEQARGDGADLRSDVYSLGVMLFELLAGTRPYELPNDLRAALDLVADPPHRNLASLVPSLPHDVHALVAKATASSPPRRYQGAIDFHRDLRRLLDGEPIEARADSAWYVIGRRLQKWRRAVLVAAALVIALGSALVVSLGALREAHEATRKQSEESERLTRALDWLVAMVQSVDPEMEGENARLVDILARTAPGLDAAFADDRRSRILLRGSLAQVYEKLGRWEEAKVACDAWIEDLVDEHGEDHVATIGARIQDLRLAFLRDRTADLDQPLIALCERSAEALGRDHELSIEASDLRARSLRARRRLEEARAIWDGLLAAAVASNDMTRAAHTRSQLAAVESMAGNPELALELQRDAVARLESALGPDHSDTWAAIGDLAYYQNRLDRLEESEALLQRLRDRVIARFGESHPRALTVSEHIAKSLQDRGQPAAAVPLFERVLALRTERMGAQHRDTLGTRNNLAVAQGLAGDLSGAELTQSALIDALDALPAPDHFDHANAHANLGTIRTKLGRFAEAIQSYDRCLSIADAKLGRQHHDTATFRLLRGSCLRRLERWAEARDELQAALPVLVSALGDTHPAVVMARRELELLEKER
ncbi:MAG: tetratricopeptide repeat protein [Planctomycetota bacterium]